jgi:signal transduction histidine kinase
MTPRLGSMSLLWRIFLSTTIAITALFAVMGWILQEQFAQSASDSVREEVRASFQAYDSLWRERADQLASVSLVLSRMPQVRAAFGTGDRATIRDAAGEMWDRIQQPDTLFLIADPGGAVIAASATATGDDGISDAPFVRAAAANFPSQARGFQVLNGKIHQIVVTPVYVASGQGKALILIDVLVAGIPVDAALGRQLKASTGGSDFVFLVNGKVAASTLEPRSQQEIDAGRLPDGHTQQVVLSGSDYYQFSSTLTDVRMNPVGELRILRSLDASRARIAEMRSRLVKLWVAAMLAGMGLTYLLARRLLRPAQDLGRAAAEIAKGNYDVRVPVQGQDEFGRLAETFNSMCASIRQGREELIRQERISTIGRLSTSIIHDLRNPLAAIYGGAEMLVDTELSRDQVRRLSANIYRASRQVQDLLQELADVTQGRGHAREICRLRDVIQAAYEPLAATAETQGVKVEIDVAGDFELPLDRSPMERVFQNLIGNAIEAMPDGGSVAVRAVRSGAEVVVSVEDTGPGIPALIASQLFQPFVTAGKKNGMGLGLALSRKTVISHGGDLWSEDRNSGAKFVMRLPV